MKKYLYLSAAMSVALFACTDDKALNPDDAQDSQDVLTEVKSNLTTVNLATFEGDQNRVSYTGTRAEGDEEVAPKTLELIASITNPYTDKVFDYVKTEDDTRLMSATSIYHNEKEDKYYITYHVQGNNYNTELITSTGGAIQGFHIDNEGKVVLETGFRPQNPQEEDFDFNHIYFDNTSNRIIAVGHNMKNNNNKNTNAIIGIFDPNAGTYTYSTVKTAEKEYKDGKSLGYMDAGDVNCVVRTNDAQDWSGTYYGWDIYLVATRKGMAVLHADDANLFQPYLLNGVNYFIKTPGSSKYIAPTGSSSCYGLLYLADAHTGDVQANMTSRANVLKFRVNTYPEVVLPTGWGDSEMGDVMEPGQDVLDFPFQQEMPEEISPIDGKNTLVLLGGNIYGMEYYAALGTAGLYCNNGIDGYEGVKTFGNRPVNCVAVDNKVNESGYSNKGYLYVANGSKLSILDRKTMAEVASYNMPSKDDAENPIESSANFVHVDKKENGERIVTVAFGQAGVKIFKFNPPVK